MGYYNSACRAVGDYCGCWTGALSFNAVNATQLKAAGVPVDLSKSTQYSNELQRLHKGKWIVVRSKIGCVIPEFQCFWTSNLHANLLSSFANINGDELCVAAAKFEAIQDAWSLNYCNQIFLLTLYSDVYWPQNKFTSVRIYTQFSIMIIMNYTIILHLPGLIFGFLISNYGFMPSYAVLYTLVTTCTCVCETSFFYILRPKQKCSTFCKRYF